MEWDMGSNKFVKTSLKDPPVMVLQVKVLSQVQKWFLGRRASLWSKFGDANPGKKVSLADMGPMVCSAGLHMLGQWGFRMTCY